MSADTDKDSLLDWEEINSESSLICYDNLGEPIFPTRDTYIQYGYSFSIPQDLLDSLAGLKGFFAQLEIVPCLSDPTMEDSDGDGLTDDDDPYVLIYNETKTYNREKAIQYAMRWWDDFNSFYYCYTNDCANFVSQCIYASGLSMNDIWYSHRGEIDHLLVGWFVGIFNPQGWNLFYEWDVSASWSNVIEQSDYFNSEDFSYELIKIGIDDDVNQIIEEHNIQIGDLVYFDHEDDGIFSHAAIVSKVDDDMIYYAGHTNPQKDREIEKYLEIEDDKPNPKIIILKMRDKVIVS